MPKKGFFSAAQWVGIITIALPSISGLVLGLFTNVLASTPEKANKRPTYFAELHKDVSLIQETQDLAFSGLRESIRRLSRQNQKEHAALRRSIEDNAVDIGNRSNRFDQKKR